MIENGNRQLCLVCGYNAREGRMPMASTKGIDFDIINKCMEITLSIYKDFDSMKYISMFRNNYMKKKVAQVIVQNLFHNSGHKKGVVIVCIEYHSKVFERHDSYVTVMHELSHVVELFQRGHSDHEEGFQNIFRALVFEYERASQYVWRRESG